MGILFSWLINVLALIATAYLIPGFKVTSFQVALIVSLILGIINASLGPIVRILTQPINFLTLGLFSIVINAAFLVVVSEVVPGFTIVNFWPTAIIGGLVLGFVSTVLTAVLKNLSKLL